MAGGRVGGVVLAIVGCMVSCLPPIGAAAQGGAPPPAHPVRQVAAGSIEDRVQTFTKSLSLDAAQQAQLRKILVQQRDTVHKIWSDPALLPAERAPATRAANERTGDAIRGILNAQQQEKYNPPKPATTAPPAGSRSVEQWMDAARPH